MVFSGSTEFDKLVCEHGGDPEAEGARMEPDPGNVDEALGDSLERVESLATNNVPRRE
jgi:hypothetical protein